MLDIVLPFWSALRELSSRYIEDDYTAQWRRDFPSEALDRLTEWVKRARLEVE